jgi:hypothetical protein
MWIYSNENTFRDINGEIARSNLPLRKKCPWFSMKNELENHIGVRVSPGFQTQVI